MTDIYQTAELNADEFVWIIVSKTKHSLDYDLNHRPFMYKAQAHIISVDHDSPEYPECEGEEQTILRHQDLIKAQCDQHWGDWVCADVVTPLFPEYTLKK